jgi:hypothetical protein
MQPPGDKEFEAAKLVIIFNHELGPEDVMKRLLVDYVKETYPTEYLQEAMGN